MFLQWGYHRQSSCHLGYDPGRPPKLTRVVLSVMCIIDKKELYHLKCDSKIDITYEIMIRNIGYFGSRLRQNTSSQVILYSGSQPHHCDSKIDITYEIMIRNIGYFGSRLRQNTSSQVIPYSGSQPNHVSAKVDEAGKPHTQRVKTDTCGALML
ncbi:hypothetical protein BDC45DRAFT_533872 [Circinella umbellata]|nr:hypothetical protein BDC45DRAFT_533872 [Circinella umbellata]